VYTYYLSVTENEKGRKIKCKMRKQKNDELISPKMVNKIHEISPKR